MVRKFGVAALSLLVLLIAIEWSMLPNYPTAVEHRFTRHLFDLAARSSYHMGKVLEIAHVSSPEYMLRLFFNAAAYIINYQHFHEEIDVNRKTIGDVHVLIQRPRRFVGNLIPVMIYFHGDGWMYGSPDTHSALTAWISQHANIAVVSVYYGLSPNITYESQVEECVAVTMNTIAMGEKYGFDSAKIFIAGDSSGGNIAAAVSLVLKNAEHLVTGTLLLSPVLQAVNFSLPSYRSYHSSSIAPVEHYIIKRAGLQVNEGLLYAVNRGLHIPAESRARWNKDYLNVTNIPGYEFPRETFGTFVGAQKREFHGDVAALNRLTKMALDPNAFPLIASDALLSGLPPTFIQACDLDFYRDDALLFANRLRNLKVRHTISLLHNGVHNELLMGFYLPRPMSNAAVSGLKDIISFIDSLK